MPAHLVGLWQLGNAIPPDLAVVIGAVLMLAFVMLAGLRSAAFSAAVKDVLMIVIVILLASLAAGRVGAASPLDIFRLATERHPGSASSPAWTPVRRPRRCG